MKKGLLAILLAAAIPLAFAGSGEGGHRDHGARWERMAESLSLSDEQRVQMKALYEQQHAQRKAQREQMHAQMAELLTPEQMEKMETMRAEGKGKGKHHGKHHDCENKDNQSS